MPCALTFESFQSHRRGLLADLLGCCCAGLLEQLPPAKAASLRHEWTDYDEAVHVEPETVGSAGFVSLAEGQVIGFGSWDPRGWPHVGSVGHNGVRPSHQGHGLRHDDPPRLAEYSPVTWPETRVHRPG